MYKRVGDFDKNNKRRIYNLLVLKGEAIMKGELLSIKRGVALGQGYQNFFSAISNQIDLLIIYFINDEISASLVERGPLRELRDELIKDFCKDEDFKRLEIAKADLFDLFGNRTDFIIGSNFLDFKVNTYSAFEFFSNELYDELIKIKPRSNKKENDLIKLVMRYNNESDETKKQNLIEKIKKINFYTSSHEKISYILSMCEMEKEESENVNAFLDYYRSQRNTVHNLGIHHGKSQSISIDGIMTVLEHGKPSYTSDYNSSIFSCRKLMGIYEMMLAKIRGEFI
ncbi:hypothetical protein HP563_14230 [Pantoea dispersa]|uniref:hypothetical protein n=1 Tax=Pantoea dispersa TaxID=59814 RepID=UPI0035273864